jgi:hypothetical protein
MIDSYKKNGGKRLSEDMFEEVPATKYRPKITERTKKKPGGGCWKGRRST